ncbi:MAG: 4-hydroxy-tetrahydrodipicolinate synthase [Clostridia bacterium]|nr:4-hydroxy-tetrahydrodipicolinate synthase [Clostridia bacterium]
MKKVIFKGAGVALVTPMNEDGSVNYEELERLINYQIDNGTDAIITCGTTGESATLTEEEHSKVIEFTVNKVAGRIPVVAGTGSNNTETALRHSLEAEKLGVDGLLIVTPYYNKTSQQGLIEHYTYIADRVHTPIILYNVPSRTGVNIKPETYQILSRHENIVAAKEAGGDISAVAKIRALCGDDLAIYSGNDDQIVPMLSLGGLGVISVFSNICPKECHTMIKEFFGGNAELSSKMQTKYLELMNAMFCDVNPVPVKEALNIMGFKCGECRMPLYRLSDENRRKVKSILEKYSLI